MSDSQNWDNIGEKFKNAVQDAISEGNFEQLNGLVNDTVDGVIHEARVQFSTQKDKKNVHYEKTTSFSSSHLNHRAPESMYSSKQTAQRETQTKNMRSEQRGRYDFRRSTAERTSMPDGGKSYDFRRRGEYAQDAVFGNADAGSREGAKTASHRTKEYPNPVKKTREVTLFKKNGMVSGTLFQVFGGIGTGLSLTTFIVFACMFIFMGYAWIMTSALISGFFALGFGVMIKCGNLLKNRLKRAQRYLELCGNNKYINIAEIAGQTGKSARYVRKDVRKMLDKGIFPQGHMDTQETCLILDDETFKQYRQLEKQKIEYLEQSKGIEADSRQTDTTLDTASEKQSREEQLDEMVKEGHECIQRLREMNDRIEGDVISGKLYRLENLLKEIFNRLKKHPELMPRMHKVMGYYLPTTLKLVAAYEEFDKMSVQGPQVLDAKAEIENTLDSINSAFGEILNTLFVDSAFDVATDAQVLKSMLEREGLTGGMPSIDLQSVKEKNCADKKVAEKKVTEKVTV